MKNIIALFVGLIAAFICIFVVESLGFLIHPIEGLEGLSDEAKKIKLIEHIESAPLNAMLLICLAYILAAFVGGLITSKMSESKFRQNAIVIGLAITIGTVLNFIELPSHPKWMWGVILLIIPSAYMGWKISKKAVS